MECPMTKLALCTLVVVCLLPFGVAAAQDPSGDANCASHPCLATYHNNNARTGLNTREVTLVANNFPAGFGASPSSVQVDGMIYAQPLYMSGVAWAGTTGTNCPQATSKNMVYIATENNTIYAIDADNYGICAQLTLNKSGANVDTAIPVTALPQAGGGPCSNLTGSMTYGTVGVTGTPAI
jgi:hypothetical protein